MPIGAINRHAQRDPVIIGQHAALGALFAAVGQLAARLFPPKRRFGPRTILCQ